MKEKEESRRKEKKEMLASINPHITISSPLLFMEINIGIQEDRETERKAEEKWRMKEKEESRRKEKKEMLASINPHITISSPLLFMEINIGIQEDRETER
jgi:hypothetical protein